MTPQRLRHAAAWLLVIALQPTVTCCAEESPPRGTATPGAAQARNPLEQKVIAVDDGFGEGWKQSVSTKEGDEPCESYEMWVDDGWFYACRVDRDGELDWQIKLAEAQRMGVPSMVMTGEGIAFHVSSEDGRYFIRETLFLLRCLRQPSGGDGAVLRTDLFSEDVSLSGYCGLRTAILSGWRGQSWFYAASGPDTDHLNCVVRLNPLELRGNGNGFQSVAGDLAYLFHGKTHVWDDGELLLASRTVRADYERELVRRRIRKSLPGSVLPEIDASKWLNTEALARKDLLGKVVLLDFWATWCGPCVKGLPKVQRLADEYKEDGLVVIGIHSARGAENCADFAAKNTLTFPIAIDTGTTQQQYAVETIPCYFLIDTTGKIVEGYLRELPDGTTIRALLDEK